MTTYKQFMERVIMNYRPQRGPGGAAQRKARLSHIAATNRHDANLKARKEKEAKARAKTLQSDAK